MIEHILLDDSAEQASQGRQTRKKRSHWLGYVFGSLVLVSATCALVYYMSHRYSQDPPLLSTSNVCDACTIYPDLSDHLTCKSCPFGFKKEKLLKCPPGYGDMRFSSVKLNGHSNAKAMVKIQKACREQYEMFDAESNEPFTCRLMMGELMAEEETPQIEPRDKEGETVEVADENGEIMLERRHRGFTTKYTCAKNEENVEIVEPETGSEMFLSEALMTEPFLANAQVKCGKRKQVSKYTEIVKSCETAGTFEATCSGTDARIIFLRFKQNGQRKSKEAKKAGKARSSLATNFCYGQDTTCTFELKDILINEETEESMQGETFDYKYICSYGEELSTDSAPVTLSSTLENPSEMLLQSALLKCGKNKMIADTVEVGKVCGDDNFQLSCNAEGKDARVIVLGFWNGKKSRTGRKVSRQRARLATEACNDGSHLENNVCSFSLADVYLTGEDETTFVDTTFNVKYLCSFSQPLASA